MMCPYCPYESLNMSAVKSHVEGSHADLRASYLSTLTTVRPPNMSPKKRPKLNSAIGALIEELIINGITKDTIVEVWSEYEEEERNI